MFKTLRVIIFLITVPFFLAGCIDPYERKLPVSGLISVAEAAKIADSLAPEDRRLFIAWHERTSRGEFMLGEVTPSNIKIALLNQKTFENEEQARKNAEKERLALEQQRLEESAIRRKKVELTHAEISKMIRHKFNSYFFSEVRNRRGQVTGYGWTFEFNAQNFTRKKIIGVAGEAEISSAFNEPLGTYPFKVEMELEPQSRLTYTLILDYDRNDPQHNLMRNSERLRMNFLYTSIVFSDGTVVDMAEVERLIQLEKIEKKPNI